ncbi:MAG: TIGR04283 family arsenosugar biosynthesis glycosyltransferase [Gammaproteobacteria bacterium]|nr:TIGR04283 family arsenosugar biosynthesis glycosyltransferase [Gammaproteobacteria bacterium]
MHRVTIIIPVLNEAGSIQNTLLPLQSYRQQGHEVIVVDGGSEDSTVSIAEHLCDKLVHGPIGRARQMNAGAEQAKGDILLFLHADTILPENAVQIVNTKLQSTSSVWGRFDVSLSGNHPVLRIVAFFMNLRSRFTGIATGDQAIFVRSKEFNQLRGFPDVALMEDIRFSKSLLTISHPICLRHKVTTSSRRWEQKGILRTIILMWYLRLAHFFGKSPKELARIYSR